MQYHKNIFGLSLCLPFYSYWGTILTWSWSICSSWTIFIVQLSFLPFSWFWLIRAIDIRRHFEFFQSGFMLSWIDSWITRVLFFFWPEFTICHWHVYSWILPDLYFIMSSTFKVNQPIDGLNYLAWETTIKAILHISEDWYLIARWIAKLNDLNTDADQAWLV